MITNQLPQEFEHRLARILPQRSQELFSPKIYQSFRINTLKITIPQAHQMLQEFNFDFECLDWCPYAIIVDRSIGKQILDSELVNNGLLYAQGLESMLPVIVLDPKPGERVLDLCAAPGSKTSQIAMLMNNEGYLQANDPVRPRMFRLKAVLELMNAKAKITTIDGRVIKDPGFSFDKILVDAPCSSEGRFQIQEPKSYAYWSPHKIKEMSHKQKGLLLNASRILKAGGSMVYSTCTFAPEENEEVVDWFLRKTDNQFEIIPTSLNNIKTYDCLNTWQKRTFNERVSLATRILPNERMDGFFIAKFKKSNYK